MKRAWLRTAAIILGSATLVGVPGGYALGSMTAETIDAGNADEAPASTLARMGGERGTLASQSALDEPVSTDGSYPAGSGETATKVSAP